jgi:DNA-binding LacI/PurR family transcriptional regulator
MLFHHEIAKGAETRAEELGFRTELFWIGDAAPALPLTSLPRILHARGISGAVLLPFNNAQDLSRFDFSRLSAVQMDHCLTNPQLHTILPDHYLSMIHTLECERRCERRHFLADKKTTSARSGGGARFAVGGYRGL